MGARSTNCLLSTLVLLLTACTEPVAPVQGPRPVVVEAPQPISGINPVTALPGAVHARSEVDLSFRIAGKVAERRVDMGTRVAAGQVLAVLDTRDARLNVAAARAAVGAAEADLVLARAEERRYHDLRARGFVGQSPLDERVNTTRLAEARLEQARAELDLAANQSRYTELRADATGVITRIAVEPGHVVSAGQVVMRFAVDGEREAHVAVPEGGLDALRRAPRLEVALLSHPDRHYRGVIRDIDPQADPLTRTHLARITIVDADAAVELGATATVLVGAEAAGDAFRLPATALGTIDGDRPAVWRVRQEKGGQTVEAIPVEVLRYLDGAIAVSGPLSPDDRLVSAGVHRLVAGMAVEAIERSAPAAL